MAIDTFNPIIKPQPGSKIKRRDRDIRNQFGDGYIQVVGDGVNTTSHILTLSWSFLRYPEYTDIMDFFDTHSHGVIFYWTLPHEVTPRKWRRTETDIDISTPTQITYSLAIEVEEAFDLDV